MSIVYTKQIISMGCYAQIDGQTDVVFVINWSLFGNDEVYTASILCVTNVTYTAGDPFIPYQDLTQQQVDNWIEEFTPAEQMIEWQNIIAANIDKQKEIVYPPLPWQPPVPPTN